MARKHIYVFGDSLSDTGNAWKIIEDFPRENIKDLPTEIQSLFEANRLNEHYFEGRYSNGLLWVDYLASKLGVAEDAISNFAVGGATTGTNNLVNAAIHPLLNAPGLQQQVESFTANNPSADSDALYIVWAGVNDYLDGVTDPTTTLDNLSMIVTSLVNAGAKNILVGDLPDYGHFPVSVDTSNSRFPGRFDSSIVSGLSSVIKAHNSALPKTLNFLRQSLGSDINLIPFQTSALFDEIISSPGNFNLTNVTNACVTSPDTVCNNPDEYLFWDNTHPTTVAHRLVADLVFSTLESTSLHQSVAVTEPS
jgi:phospholipase/lecithinase/hemolysin